MGSEKILLFGDLSVDFEDDLRALLHIRDNPLLCSFLEQSGARIRDEIGRLSTPRQNLFPRFTTLVDLVSKLGETEGTPILNFCLLSVCQVGQFLDFYSRDGRHYPSPQATYCLGVCAGSFAAAAVSCSRSLTELIPVSIEAVVAAFHTSLCSYTTKDDIVGSDGRDSRVWSVVMSGEESDFQKKLDDFAVSHHLQQSWKPYISAVTPNHLTLSGPPVILKTFVATMQAKAHELSIESPYHAQHLFDEHIANHIIGSQSLESYKPYLTLISPATGQMEIAHDYKCLLEAVVKNCLREQVRWDQIVNSAIETFCEKGIEHCEILTVTSNTPHLLSTALGRFNINAKVQKVSIPSETSAQGGRFSDSKIAIVGYSGRFPDSASNEEFWELLRAGKDLHREVPPDRFDWKTHYDPTGKTKNTSRIKYGCWIEEPGLFDARFFNISPREAENTDPAQRLAITTVYEAMEMAGMVPNRTPSTQQDRIGVFFGTTSDDWREVNSGQDVDTYFIPGGNRAFVPGRISYFFRFSGPSLSMDTACSSSFAAIQTACAYLWRGECDTAVAGGTNVLTNPDNFVGLDRGHFLTTTGNCNTFDDDASGYCRADAVGSVILKRLEDAEMDNDPIFGIIAGATTNHCGQTDSITRPHEGDQVSVFKRILRNSGVNPLDISYIEMHGTGTQAGDATEMNSVLSVFVPESQRMPRHPLYVGSAKANMGHAESASGVSSLIKVLMMMKHSEIPPHCGIKTKLNHNYPGDLNERNVNIAFKPTPWLREHAPCGKRFAFLNNFSAAGGNTAVLLEDTPLQEGRKGKDPRTFHLVALSSRTAKSLRGNMEALINYLDSHPDIEMPNLAYTTTARRIQHSYRVTAIGNDTASISQSLRSKLNTIEPKTIPPPTKLPKVVFVFTGQGSFYRGVGKELFTRVASFKEDVKRFNKISQQQGFPCFLDVIENDDETKETDPVITQLATTCTQMALAQMWRSWGIKPNLTIGHSLGEYAALFAANVLSVSDTIYLVGTRAQLLKRHCKYGTHSMLAVKASKDKINNLISGCPVEIACFNQPTSNVISGRVEEIDRLKSVFKAAGHETTSLDVPFAFHSSQVEPILDDFDMATEKASFRAPSIPYISPLLSQVVSEGGILGGSYLVKACRQAVDFQGALEEASSSGLINESTIWLEVGTHPVCSGMIKGTLGSNSKTAATLRKDTDPWKMLITTLEILYLKGFQIDWNEYHRDFCQFLNVIEMPLYSWDLKNYWIKYRNDFCLTKGEGTQLTQEAPITGSKSFKRISPSLQQVIEESHGDGQSSIVVESDVHDPKLLPIFTGHKVNGAELCPSSLWGDITLNLASYLMEQRSLSTEVMGMDVSHMEIEKPLVYNSSLHSQLFRVSAVADWQIQAVKVSIYSVNALGQQTANHASCSICLMPTQGWEKEWKRNSYLVRSRINALRDAVENGAAHRLKQAIVYRLFTNIVEYSAEYQGMREVILDSNELEAVSTVQFQVDDQGFYFNPKWMDSVGGVAGFIMNGNSSPHPMAEVFINNEWESMKLISRPEHGKIYHCYNRMQLLEGTLYSGDTYIFDGDRIIGVIEQIKFLGVPRRALDGLRPVGKKPVLSDNIRPMRSLQESNPKASVTSAPKKDNPAPAANDSTSSSNIWLGILVILSEELGIDVGDLKPDTEFAELGLDSLLSLTVTGRIREELDLDLSSSIFVDCPTVKDLQQLQGSGINGTSLPSTNMSSSGGESGTSTPETSLASENEVLDYVLILRSTIAEETGIKVEELSSSTGLDEIGVDSLLALTCLGRLGEIFDAELPSTLFADNETLSGVENAIASVLGVNAMQPTPTPVLSPQQHALLQSDVVKNAPHATSVLLQGSPKSASSFLFMFPDGSGSASSYATLSKIDPKVAVYGLNCPWRTTPQDMALSKCTLQQLSAKYVIELKRRQPSGPYNLGGWSAGGICAFEAARQLVSSGDVVETLILIDAPNPIGLQNPPSRMYDFFQQLGIFGTGSGIPKWLRPHFDAFIGMLDEYEPVAWPSSLGSAPNTLMIYAPDGVCKDPNGPRPEIRPDDPREMIWLINNRTDFSANGWASLLGRDRLTVEVLKQVNHFSMMDFGPQMDEMCAHMKKVLS